MYLQLCWGRPATHAVFHRNSRSPQEPRCFSKSHPPPRLRETVCVWVFSKDKLPTIWLCALGYHHIHTLGTFLISHSVTWRFVRRGEMLYRLHFVLSLDVLKTAWLIFDARVATWCCTDVCTTNIRLGTIISTACQKMIQILDQFNSLFFLIIHNYPHFILCEIMQIKILKMTIVVILMIFISVLLVIFKQ